MVTLASLFDGIGGAALCAELCGAVPVWSSEIEKFPILVTKTRFQNMKHHGDITKINGAEVEPVDIIVGGSPCQDLSLAGKRAGMKHEDMGDEDGTRSGLFMEQIRIVKEMRDGTNGVQPRFMVWENVPGAFSSAGGEDFRAVLEETARIADPTVSIPRSPGGWANSGSILGEGFSISWRTVDAQYWGVPQRRRRIYLVADFGGQSAPEILFEQQGVSWHFEKGESKGQGTAGEVEDSVRATVAYGISSFESNAMKSDNPKSGIYEADTSRTLDANGGNPACNQGGIVVLDMTHANDVIRECGDQAYTMLMREGKEGGEKGPLIQEERASTLTTSAQQTLFEQQVARMTAFGKYETDGTFSTMKSRDYKDATDLIVSQTVRRLTPLECERLQGYQDLWTDILGQDTVTEDDIAFWRPIFDTYDDINKKKHHTDKQIERWLKSPSSDSDRYEALGNSFAIPNAYFVISGCVEEIRRKRE